jgi:hypothetical protein
MGGGSLRSGLFDRSWYLAGHPDVADLGIDPVRHYVESGGAALTIRNSAQGFDVSGDDERDDVATAFLRRS